MKLAAHERNTGNKSKIPYSLFNRKIINPDKYKQNLENLNKSWYLIGYGLINRAKSGRLVTLGNNNDDWLILTNVADRIYFTREQYKTGIQRNVIQWNRTYFHLSKLKMQVFAIKIVKSE